MFDNKFDRLIRNRKRGKLDDHSLYKIPQKRVNVFKKKEERKGKEYNVMLCIDQSGSMISWGSCGEGSKIYTAIELTKFLFKSFQKAGINIGLIGFSEIIREYAKLEKRVSIDEFEKIVSNLGVIDGYYNYKGYYPYHFHDKNWPEPDSGHNICYGNHDYWALETCYKRLKNKPNPILIVLSDGIPSCDEPRSCHYPIELHDKSKIRELINNNKKIPTLGVGVLTNSVADIYPNFIVINDLDTLKPRILEYLKKIIKRG